MIRTLLCTTLALGASWQLLVAADVFTGSWRLDLAASTFASDNPPPRELTLTFTEQGSDRTQTLMGIAADGSAISTAWTAPTTGGIAIFPPGQGPNGGASVRTVGDTTLVMTQTLPNGKVGVSRTYQVSADGQTLTLAQKRADGQERARMAFRRR